MICYEGSGMREKWSAPHDELATVRARISHASLPTSHPSPLTTKHQSHFPNFQSLQHSDLSTMLLFRRHFKVLHRYKQTRVSFTSHPFGYQQLIRGCSLCYFDIHYLIKISLLSIAYSKVLNPRNDDLRATGIKLILTAVF